MKLSSFKQIALASSLLMGFGVVHAESPAINKAPQDHAIPKLTSTPAEDFIDGPAADLIKCSADRSEIAAEDRDALDTLNSQKLGMRQYLGRKGHDQASYDKVNAASNRVLAFLAKYDPKTCLSGGLEEFHYYCTVASNIDFLSIRGDDLVVSDRKNGVEFRRRLLDRKPNLVGASWEVWPKGATQSSAHIVTGSGYNKTTGHELASSIGFSQWYTETNKRDFINTKVNETNIGVKDIRFNTKDLGFTSQVGCQGPTSKPADIYAAGLAKAKGQGYDVTENSFETQKEKHRAAGWKEGGEEIKAALGNSWHAVVDGAKGMVALLKNEEIVADHPTAVACKDPKNKEAAKAGKKCLGTFDAMTAILGPKIGEARDACLKEVCPTCKSGKGTTIQMTQTYKCMSGKAYMAGQDAVWNTAIKCFSKPNEEMQRCSAHLLTAALSFGVATVGAKVINKGAAVVSAKLATGVSRGAITGTTAKAATAAVRIVSKTGVFTVDMLINQTPMDPGDLAKMSIQQAKKVASINSIEQLKQMKEGIPTQRIATLNDKRALEGVSNLEKAIDERIAKLDPEFAAASKAVDEKAVKEVADFEARSSRPFTTVERQAAIDHVKTSSFDAKAVNIDDVVTKIMHKEAADKIPFTGKADLDFDLTVRRTEAAQDVWKAAGRPAIDQKYLDTVVAPIMRGQTAKVSEPAGARLSSYVSPNRNPAAVKVIQNADAHLAALSKDPKWSGKAIENMKHLMDESEAFTSAPDFAKHVDARRAKVLDEVKTLEAELAKDPKAFDFEKRSNLTQARAEAKELSQAGLDHEAARKASARKFLRENNVPEKDVHQMMNCFK